jgi:hypothetical protein
MPCKCWTPGSRTPPDLDFKHPGLKLLIHLQVKDIIMDAGDLETLSDRLGLEGGGPIHRRQDAALALSA